MPGDKKDYQDGDSQAQAQAAEPIVGESHEVDPFALRVVEIPNSKWVRRYRSVAFQMVVLAMLSFSGPSMSNAISSLGGGGLATPYTANIASATQYSTSILIAMFGGPIISTVGIPIACMVGALGFPLSGSGFYVNSKYGIQWYLIFAKAVYGITSAFLYVAEASVMISYPEEHRRGFYISIWVIMRNVGSIIAGGISFGLNIARDGYGGVTTNTYLVFLSLECLGLPAAFLLSRTKRVIRSDGWGVPLLPKKTWKQECKLLLLHHMERRTLLLIPIYILTYFGDGVWGTYLSLHFSVRARALHSLVTPLLAVLINPLFGMILDMKRFGPKRKATIAFWVWTIPSAAMLIWVMVNLKWFTTQPDMLRLDYAQPTTGRWFSMWFPYVMYVVTCWMSQTLVYWVLGQFASDVATNARTGGVFRSWETVGQAVSYGINSRVANQFIPFGVYLGLFAVAMPLFWIVLMDLPTESRVLAIVDDDGNEVGHLGKTMNVERGEGNTAREIS
ncbi:duf895 domain protein membrane protein [Hypoxylon crocopeplum]|nr:duf895 domain protein membrane protein [Hypoxylon crocopeplum]